MSHVTNPLTNQPLNHPDHTNAEFDALSPEAKAAEYDLDAAGLSPSSAAEELVGFATKQQALDAGLAAGIDNPGAVPFNNRFFFTDPSTSIPTGTWSTAQEAQNHAQSINRPDLVASFDSRTGRFRLEEPVLSPPAGAEWLEDIGKFVVTLADGRSMLVDPPPLSIADKPFGTEDIPGTNFVLVNDGQGGTSIVAKSEANQPSFELGDIQRVGQFQFIETSPGNFQRLADEPQQGEVIEQGGRQFIRQPDGSLQPLAPEPILTIDQMVSQRLSIGDVDGALALQDFKDRPTSLEAFNAAMQFAQSPGDVFSISNIARGVTQITAPEVGQTQRIAEQPLFLQDAMSRVMNLFKGGTGTPNDFVSIINQIATSENIAQKDKAKAQDDAHKAQVAFDRQQAEAGLEAEGQADIAAFLAQRAADAPAIATAQEQVNQIAADTRLSDVGVSPGGGRALTLDVTSGISAGSGAGGTVTQEPISAFQQQFLTGGTEEDDFLHRGGVLDDGTAIVGEDGPELLVGNVGARVIPLPKGDAEKIKKKFGIKGMQGGGTLEPLLPFGIRQVLTGGSPEPTRRRLSTAAGIPVLSAQARERLLPEELEVFDRIRAESGIPAGAFAQEQASALPGAAIQRAFRLAPRVSR